MKLFFRFAGAGAVGTILHYAVLIVLVSLCGVQPSPAAMLGAAAGAIVNYFINYSFSFAVKVDHRKAVPKFILMALLGIILNGALVKLLTISGINFLLAQVLSTITILFLNFFISKTWIFVKNS